MEVTLNVTGLTAVQVELLEVFLRVTPEMVAQFVEGTRRNRESIEKLKAELEIAYAEIRNLQADSLLQDVLAEPAEISEGETERVEGLTLQSKVSII